MNIRCIMLGLENASFVPMLKNAILNNLDIVNQDYCLENGYTMMCETEPHVTLFYGFTEMGENLAYSYLKIKNREAYKELKQIRDQEGLVLPEVIIDTFDNEDNRVLKINLENSNLMQALNKYYQFFRECPNDSEHNGPDYHPHITLTYLKPDTTDEQIQKLIESIDKDKLKYWIIRDFILSGGDDKNSDYNAKIKL